MPRTEKKTKGVSIMMTPSEFDRMAEAAAGVGLAPSTFMRLIAIDYMRRADAGEVRPTLTGLAG